MPILNTLPFRARLLQHVGPRVSLRLPWAECSIGPLLTSSAAAQQFKQAWLHSPCTMIQPALVSRVLLVVIGRYLLLYSSANEYYTQVPMSTILKCRWVLYSSANEYYTQVPMSTILKCQWELYSSANEYCTHVPLKTIEQNAIYWLEYGYMRYFFTDTRYFIASKNDVAI